MATYDRKKIKELIKATPKLNEEWYILNTKWLNEWQAYDSDGTDSDNEKVSIIDNGCIMESGQVNSQALFPVDIEVVPLEAWNLLIAHYGCAHSKYEQFRRTVVNGPEGPVVEIHPPTLSVASAGKPGNVKSHLFSGYDNIGLIYEFARDTLYVPQSKKYKLHQTINNKLVEIDVEDNVLIQDAGIDFSKVIIVDYLTENGSWSYNSKKYHSGTSPDVNTTGSKYSTRFSTSNYSQSQYPIKGKNRGICGLSNLGNTCFMNAALQCISNVPCLNAYFLSDTWKSELNTNNPLGMKGKIATTFAALMKTMWSGDSSYAIPRDFKVAVAQFAPQFSGYAQHDSQELMNFLLDGLHEDLNRIKKKPYSEVKDANGRNEHEVAEEAWAYHTSRNDSVIVDQFHGQLKSKVVCPDCQFVSVTFDPFASLSLPVIQDYYQQVSFLPWNEEVPIQRLSILMNKSNNIRDLLDAIIEIIPQPNDSYFLVAMEVSASSGYRHLTELESIQTYMRRDNLLVYQLRQEQDHTLIPVNMKKRDRYGSFERFGFPLFISINKSDSLNWNSVTPELDRILTRLYPFNENNQLISPFDLRKNSDSSTDGDLTPPNDMEVAENEVGSVVDGFSSDEAQQNTIAQYFNIYLTQGDCHVELTPISRNVSMKDTTISLEWTKEGLDTFYDQNRFEYTEKHQSYLSSVDTTASISLDTCFDSFVKSERLGSNDMWYCPKCKESKMATKKFDLWRLPKVLVLCFKRFRSGHIYRDKIDTKISFPICNLDLNARIESAHTAANDYKTFLGLRTDYKYHLCAISNHMGGLGGGHYTAYGRNCLSGTWYNFDDSTTSVVSDPKSVVTKSAYVLVYMRDDVLPADEVLSMDHLYTWPFISPNQNKHKICEINTTETKKSETRKSEENTTLFGRLHKPGNALRTGQYLNGTVEDSDSGYTNNAPDSSSPEDFMDTVE